VFRIFDSKKMVVMGCRGWKERGTGRDEGRGWWIEGGEIDGLEEWKKEFERGPMVRREGWMDWREG
jgi:hypothetical protein